MGGPNGSCVSVMVRPAIAERPASRSGVNPNGVFMGRLAITAADVKRPNLVREITDGHPVRRLCFKNRSLWCVPRVVTAPSLTSGLEEGENAEDVPDGGDEAVGMRSETFKLSTHKRAEISSAKVRSIVFGSGSVASDDLIESSDTSSGWLVEERMVDGEGSDESEGCERVEDKEVDDEDEELGGMTGNARQVSSCVLLPGMDCSKRG